MKELLSTVFSTRIAVDLFLLFVIAGLWTIARKVDVLK